MNRSHAYFARNGYVRVSRGRITTLALAEALVLLVPLPDAAWSAPNVKESGKPGIEQTVPDANTQGDLGRPYNLPMASRARVHACGVEWQKMKLSGAAADEIWRVFASVCLKEPDPKLTPPHEDADHR